MICQRVLLLTLCRQGVGEGDDEGVGGGESTEEGEDFALAGVEEVAEDATGSESEEGDGDGQEGEVATPSF